MYDSTFHSLMKLCLSPTLSSKPIILHIYRGLVGNARAVGVRGTKVDPRSPVVFQETKFSGSLQLAFSHVAINGGAMCHKRM